MFSNEPIVADEPQVHGASFELTDRTTMKNHIEIWRAFCERMRIAESGVPLFDSAADGRVRTRTIGSMSRRDILCRSPQMERLVISEADRLIADWNDSQNMLDGLIYVMFIAGDEPVTPLYIGKTETYGRGKGNLSANIRNLATDRSKFARWGDNYAYHIGDLSAVALPGHAPEKANRKYQDWARALFEQFPSEAPRLKQPVYFWTRAWSGQEIGVWPEFGPTRLTFLEYLMIGVASSAFPDTLLNREGRNRG